MTTLAERIKQRREALDMTQEVLGELIGKNQKQIWQYETSRIQPTASVLNQLADALDTTADWLLGRTDNPDRLMRNANDLDDLERKIMKRLRTQDRVTREKILKTIETWTDEPQESGRIRAGT